MRHGLISFDPFRELSGSWNDDFIATGSAFVPATNVRQDKNNVLVEMDLPGIKESDLEISVENDVLTVSGKREEKKEVKKEDYYRKEVRIGSFSRSVILPMTVKSDKAEAEMEGGVLKITLPKAEEMKPKKIAVKVKK